MCRKFALCSIRALFYRQSGADSAYREIVPDGLYLEYCSFGTMRDMVKVCHYHDKTHFSSEVVRCGASQKKPLWDSSKTYSPKGFTFRDVQLMPYFHGQMNL